MIWDADSTGTAALPGQATIIFYIDYWNSHIAGLTASTSAPILLIPNMAAQAIQSNISQTISLLSAKPHDDFSSHSEEEPKSLISYSLTHSTSISAISLTSSPTSFSHSLHSSHTSLLAPPQTWQFHSHLALFALAPPSASNVFPPHICLLWFWLKSHLPVCFFLMTLLSIANVLLLFIPIPLVTLFHST